MQEPRKPGRPSTFTPERAKLILSLITDGVYLTEAAAEAGVSKSTVQRWIRHGKRTGAANQAYQEFRNGYAQARAKASIVCQKLFHQSATKDPKMAVEWLRFNHPDRWGADRAEMRAMRKEVAELKQLLQGKVEGKGDAAADD